MFEGHHDTGSNGEDNGVSKVDEKLARMEYDNEYGDRKEEMVWRKGFAEGYRAYLRRNRDY